MRSHDLNRRFVTVFSVQENIDSGETGRKDRYLNDEQSLQRLADALVDEGLAIYESAIDRRTKNLCMTEKGRELLSNLAEYENEWVARISQRLSVEELTDLTQALEKVRAV